MTGGRLQPVVIDLEVCLTLPETLHWEAILYEEYSEKEELEIQFGTKKGRRVELSIVVQSRWSRGECCEDTLWTRQFGTVEMELRRGSIHCRER